jgi:hypothetical protein
MNMANIDTMEEIINVNAQDSIAITVQIDVPLSKLVLVNLNLKDKLSNIRKILEKNSIVKMNDTFSFAKFNSIGKSKLAEITREEEEKIMLENIIDKESKTLYLKSKPNWRFFVNKLKLEYGRNVTLEKANNRAFTIIDCKMNEIVDEYKNITIQIDSNIKNDLLLITDIDIAKPGVSSNVKYSNIVTNLTYTSVIEYNKVSLKFRLEPTVEFIDMIKEVIDSKNSRKFKDVVNEFGQFIPKEIILGGRAYFIVKENSEENVNEHDTNISGQTSNIRIEKKSFKYLTSKYQSFKLFGGKQFNPNSFNETEWAESLRDFRNWSCIKFKDSVNIFQPLSKDLRKQILSLVGKKILFTSIEDYSYELSEPGSQLRDIPKNILEILQNKEADCNIFTTVIDKGKKDIFVCQIIWPPNEDPRLIIHCIQKKFRKRECKLKIMYMIVGYDMNFDFNHSDFNVKLKVLENNFSASNHQAITESLDLEYDSSILCFGIPILNKLDDTNNSLVIGHHFINDKENERIETYLFSYCLKKNHYVNLPNFTFYTLIISNYSNSDNYGILPINHDGVKTRMMYNFTKSNVLISEPKFVSLYSMKENPIFLKQKTGKVKVKYIEINCDRYDCICKYKKLKKPENNLKYAFLNPFKVFLFLIFYRNFNIYEKTG